MTAHIPDDSAHACMCGDSPNPEDFLSTEEFEERRDDAIELLTNRMMERDYEDA